MSRNGRRLAVGLPGVNANISSLDVGRVDVFDLEDDEWVLDATIDLPGKPSRADFGDAIALSRDGKRIVVVSPFRKNDLGIVSVFETSIGSPSNDNGKEGGNGIEANETDPVFSAKNSTSGETTPMPSSSPTNQDDADTFRQQSRQPVWYQVTAIPDDNGTEPMVVPSRGESTLAVAASETANVFVVGASQSLSTNGTVIGIARVFRFVNDTRWARWGPDIVGKQSSQFGHSVAMSASGTRIAVGAPTANGAGEVRVYDCVDSITPTTTTTTNVGSDTENDENIKDKTFPVWIQAGSTLRGAAGLFGSSLAFSDDGMVLAVGAPRGIGQNNAASAGVLHVFAFDTSTNEWKARGAPIYGRTARGFLGKSVSLSSDGSVVAAGGPQFVGEGGGEVRVFSWNGKSQSWVEHGSGLQSDSDSEQLGASVSLSGDGIRMAAGAPFASFDGRRRRVGRVVVHDKNL